MPRGRDIRFLFIVSVLALSCLCHIIASSLIHANGSYSEDNDKGFPASGVTDLNVDIGSDIHGIPPFVSPLYLKLNASDILDNQNRANIYGLISNNPGISFGTVTRELRISNGTVQHHLRILESQGYIQSKRKGRQTRYYPAGTKVSELSDTQDSILMSVKENPGISQSDIARNLNISRQLVNYNIKILESKGLIEVIRVEGKSSCYSFEDYSRQ